MRAFAFVSALLAGLTGCATPDKAPVVPPQAAAAPRVAPKAAPQPRTAAPERRSIKPIVGPALVVRLLPPGVSDKGGWAADIHAAMAALGIEASVPNLCAVVAITEQESGFRADPTVPGLPAIARREIDRRRQLSGVPALLVEAALALPSSNGLSYQERLNAATTERELSDLFEDFAGRVPLAKSFLAGRNPVRTGGPMQVDVRFAERHVAAHSYRYSPVRSIRDEVFTRRGGVYFGIAHLLHYPAPYDDVIYRFADYNAGRYASRNAAFQKALGEVAGVPLEQDGYLLTMTERAALQVSGRLGLVREAIRSDLALAETAQFEQTRLYRGVFALADALHGRPVERAVLPLIALRTAKTTRRLTTDGFARRAAERYRACLARA